MKIFNVKVDANKYQWVMPQVDEADVFKYSVFDCKPKQDLWKELEWHVFNPMKERGNFFENGTGGALIFDNEVYKSDLFSILEMSGEIIPIQVENETLYILNVLECVNSLNVKDSKWQRYDDGTQGRLLEYSFYINRFTESSVFKIPQTCKGEILTYKGLKDAEEEFKSLYESLGFKGLIFDQLFSS